jgi:solute carrier family 36 (proton-coupled amino acid transporter)
VCCFLAKRKFHLNLLACRAPTLIQRRFFNGGILFSCLVLVFIALISLWSFLLLVQTKFVVSGSLGGAFLIIVRNLSLEKYPCLDIGGVLYGPYMRTAILTSITVSQLGFVSAYTIFVAENLRVGYPSTSSQA